MDSQENLLNQEKPKDDIKKRYKALIDKWGNLASVNNAYFRLTGVILVLIALPLVVSLSLKQQDIRQNAAGNCSTSLQSQINSAANGSTLSIDGCTFTESVTISKPLTLLGGRIDGQNSRSTAIRISSSDVTINGTEILNHTTAQQQGAIDADNVDRVKLINIHSHNNTGPGFSLTGGSGHRITGGEVDHNKQEGYHMTGVSDVVVDGLKVDNNNVKVNGAWPVDPFWEAGAGKTTRSNNVTFQNCIVYNNGGVGIWFDIDGNNTKILNNYVYNNDLSGIMFEISSNAVISGNKVWNNGASDQRGWGWPANILVSSTKTVEVANNIVGNGVTGISLISQNRENGYTAMSGINVHDNTILAQSTGKLIGWYDDHNGGSFNDTSNRGANGIYEGPDGNKFEWNSATTNLATYNGTRAEENGRYLSSAEKSAAAAQLSVPSGGQAPTATPTPASNPPTATPTPTVAPTQTRAPYPQGSSAKAVPGIIQAEDYDIGGEGLAYHDIDSGNTGGVYRSDNVDIKTSADTNGGYTIGWFAGGEYLTYSVNVSQTIPYDIQLRIGSQLAGRTIHLEVDGSNVSGTINVPQMANWDQYQTVNVPKITLSKGAHILKVVNEGQDFLDFNWINIIASQTTIPTPTNPPPTPTATPKPTATPVPPTPTPTKIPTPTPTIHYDPQSTIQVLAVSSSYDRSNPTNLIGGVLNGKRYIFVSNSSTVTKVRFWLDNPQMSGTPRQTESTSPFDFAGTAKGNYALSFNTLLISNGSHNISAAVDTTQGSFILTANFIVNNANPTPNGLAGAYYLNRTLSGTPLYRIDPTINFNWGQTTAPISGVGTDNYSIRWTGFIVPKYSETYTFYSNEDDGLRLWINNVLIIDEWHGWDQAEHTGTIKLNANQKYPIKVEYYEQGGSALETLSWSSPSTPKAVTPQSQLLLY